MKMRDKILYGFIFFVALALLVDDVIKGKFNGSDGIAVAGNLLWGTGVTIAFWFFAIKLCFWIYDRIRGLIKKPKQDEAI